MKDISFREEKRRDFSFQGKAAINIDTLFIKSDFHRTIKKKKKSNIRDSLSFLRISCPPKNDKKKKSTKRKFK